MANILIDNSDPQVVIESDGSKGKDIRGQIQVYSTEDAPTYEFTYWNGRLTNDTQGNVYPNLVRSYATIGSEGVKWDSATDANEKKQLEISDFLKVRQSEGKIRVDSFIGLLPEDAGLSHEAYVEFANTLCDIDILRKLKQHGCKVTTPFKYKISKALLLKRAQAKTTTEKTDYDKAIIKAEKGYQKWAKIFEQLNNEGD